MDDENGVVRIEHSGPTEAGLVEWDAMDPETLVSEVPVQRGHLYDEDPAHGYLVGVWDCTPYVERFGPYPVDEFMVLLEGTVNMALADGSEIVVEAGQAFIIPKGLQCQWKMSGQVRKVFMILDGRESPMAVNPSLTRITVLSLDPADATDAPGDTDITVEKTCFLNADGRMRVSVSRYNHAVIPAVSAPAHRLVHVLDGKVSLGKDASAQFASGDTFYVPRDTSTIWHVASGTRLLEARFTPDSTIRD